MKVRTHVKLGELALNNMNAIPEGFSRIMFNFGLVIIDQSWHVKTHPHFMQKSLGYVFKKVEKLLSVKKFNAYTSMQLGIAVHYLCDFCCHVHASGSIGNLLYHVQYEYELQKYLLENYDSLKEHSKESLYNMNFTLNNISQIKISIESTLRDYYKGEASYLWDITNSIEITSIVCSAIFANAKLLNDIDSPAKLCRREVA